jgi:hypothetical protein
MALIDRYSCELESTMREVTKEMDHIRIEKLNHIKKKAVRIKINQICTKCCQIALGRAVSRIKDLYTEIIMLLLH